MSFFLFVGFRQGCVTSPWLFNVLVDGVMREMNVRVLGGGLKLVGLILGGLR